MMSYGKNTKEVSLHGENYLAEDRESTGGIDGCSILITLKKVKKIDLLRIA